MFEVNRYFGTYIIVVMKDNLPDRVFTSDENLNEITIELSAMSMSVPEEEFRIMYWGKRTGQYHYSSFNQDGVSLPVKEPRYDIRSINRLLNQ